jgi:hypothetical protein
MKVGELIKRLQEIDSTLEILCWNEDANSSKPNHLFQLLDIIGVNITEGETRRSDDQTPSIKLGHTSLSRKYAMIEVTGDF